MADPVTAVVAVGWGMKAAGWLVSPIICELVKKGLSYLGFDASKKLKELETGLLLLERVTEAVKESPYRPRLEQLFKDLKSAFYEAEDILDVVEYHRIERQIIKDNKLKSDVDGPPRTRDWVKKLQSVIPSSSFPLKNQESGTLKFQLKKSLEKIEKVINDACQILERLNLPCIANCNGRQVFPAYSRIAVTTAAPPLKVFGRDEERDKIIAMLHEKECDGGQQNTNSDLCYSVLGIHGIAGSGKSTLAQFVYARVKEEKQQNKAGHFDLLMWVHVSQKFNSDAILRELIEGATGNPCPQFNSRNVLQENLVEKLHGKRIFLVLDDVWHNSRDTRNQEDLQQILSLLKFGEIGSKILVTSRSKDALLALGAVEERCIPISDLDGKAFFEMFMHYALRDIRIDGHDRAELERIGADIAKKLKRSPLAARTVGAQLCLRPNVEFWRRTNDRDLLDDTMGALWWSYQQLDGQVRRCFAYCSIYPRRHLLKRKELVQLWMAEGFIKTTNATQDLYGIGQDYFDELLSASFLQLGERRVEFGYEVDYFTVHDLLRDLAEEAARGDCFRIEKGFTGEVPLDVRHLFVGSYVRKTLAEKISELQNLRTLIFEDRIPYYDEVFHRLFKRLRKLRVLILRFTRHDGCRTFSVPACIAQLKHLRYLHFDVFHKDRLILPDSITELYHIQLLDVSDFGDVVFSGGKNMIRLVNLRSLRASQDLGIPNIGRLKWLQMLPFFGVRKEQGYGLRQLKDLNKLEGKLSLMYLENVESKEEAIEANLATKERLTDLVLSWNDTSCCPEVEAEVIEGLCPPKCLEMLHVWGYHGSKYPNWMVGKHNGGPTNLRTLCLFSCIQLQPAPELFEVLVHLRVFSLWFSNWHALPDNMELLTSLQQLHIYICLKIRSLPVLPRSLEQFHLSQCNDKFMRSCETPDDPNWQKIQHIPKKVINNYYGSIPRPRLNPKQLQQMSRFYSLQWRTWASCFIQAAWRRHLTRKADEEQRRREITSKV